MYALPDDASTVFSMFAPLFSRRVLASVQALLAGAILAPGQRTVASALRALGLAHDPHFQNYHRVLNRAVWSSRLAARILLQALVAVFCPSGPVLVGLDETLERRRGPKIQAKGIYRDAVRSSHSHFVKSHGLRWISMMLLVPVPWAQRVWALPFFSVLAPSERYHQERHLPHRTLVDWACLMVVQVRRWLPARPLVLVGDASYAALKLLERCRTLPTPVTLVSRLRLDARLCAPPPPRPPGTTGRPRKVGERLPTLQQVLDSPSTRWRQLRVKHWYSEGTRLVECVTGTALWYHTGQPAVPLRWVLLRDPQQRFRPQALFCTDLTATPAQILAWFIPRWQLETTFQAVRTHLGVETQRQWNEKAIARTTPVLLALFSLVTLIAHRHFSHAPAPVQETAWYHKPRPTFVDALAFVRCQLWQRQLMWTSARPRTRGKLTPLQAEHALEVLSYAA
jgi:hypothetical protein